MNIFKIARWTFIIAALSCSASQAADVPKFVDYLAEPYRGLEAPLRLDSPQARKYANALRKAESGNVNFAGRYIFVTLPAGKDCKTGAAIDVSSGRAIFLPFKTCPEKRSDKAFYVKMNSRLLVAAGKIEGQGQGGAHFFDFKDDEFVAIEEKPSDIAPAAGPKADTESTVNEADATSAKGIAMVKADPKLSQLWGCYEYGIQQTVGQVAEKMETQTKYTIAIVNMGGFTLIGDKVRRVCDKTISEQFPDIPPHVIRSVSEFFLMNLVQQDEKLFEECLAKKGDEWGVFREFCTRHKQEFEANLKLTKVSR